MKKSSARLISMFMGLVLTGFGVADSIWDVAPQITPDKLLVAGSSLVTIAAGAKESKGKEDK